MMLSLLLSVALSLGSQEFESSAASGAAVLARAKMLEDAMKSSPVSGKLGAAMDAEPAAHRTRAGSEKICREIYRAEVAGDLRKKAAETAAGLSVEFPEGGISDEEIEKIVSKHFSKVFSQERAQVVGAQAKTIAVAIKAPETDFETKDDATLVREMTAKIVSRRRTAVFEENLKYISDSIVKPVIEDGRREMKRQREYLNHARSDADTPSGIEKEILSNLAKNVASRKKSAADGALSWGVFPATAAKAAGEVVERRILERVSRNVDDVVIALDAPTVMKTIAIDPAGHFKTADSEKIFRAVYAAELIEGALRLSEKNLSGEARKEFSEYVRDRLAAPRLTRAVNTRLRREVLPKWRKARAEAAKSEAAKIWPDLVNRTWYPDADLADRIAARSDYAAAVAKWRQEPELSTIVEAGASAVVLEETAGEADRSMAAAFDLSRNAINAQNEIISLVEPHVLAEAKDRKSSFWKRTPDLPSIVAMLTDAVKAKWNETRVETLWKDGELPKNAGEQHAELFPSVKKRIELVARSIFEQMEKPEIVPEKKPEDKPEEPEDSDSTDDEPEEAEYTITVSRSGDEISVKLESGSSAVIERKVKARMDDFRSAVKTVADKLGTDFLKLR